MSETKELEWISIGEHHAYAAAVSFDEYVDSTGQYCKQVWSDGYEEVFELSGKKL